MILMTLEVEKVLLLHSPFAPLDENPSAAGRDEGAPPHKDDEGMTLVNQVVHPDCRPVLEFGIVKLMSGF